MHFTSTPLFPCMTDAGDPTEIRSLAVTVEDVVAALELNQTTARRAVLRVTPPFSGRMRARLHVVLEREPASSEAKRDGDQRPLHVDPESLLKADAPSYPKPSETEDELRNDPGETYSVERHHDRHVVAVADWRTGVADAICERTTIQTPAGPHEVDVLTLGDPPAGDSDYRTSS